MEINSGLSSEKTPPRFIIAHCMDINRGLIKIILRILKKIHLRYNYLYTTGKDRVKLPSSS